MYHVYVLQSQKEKRRYIGMTDNVPRRLKEHNSKKTKSTKGYAPWALVYQEEHGTRMEARQREKWLKSGVGREHLDNILDP